MAVKFLKVLLIKTSKVLIYSKRLYRALRPYIVFLYVAFLFTFTIIAHKHYYCRNRTTSEAPIGLNEAHRLMEIRLKEYNLQEKGTGCTMPVLDPFSAEIMEFDEVLPKITCEGIDWVNCYKSECYVVKEVLENMSDISCIYSDIIYVNDEIYYVSGYTTIRGSDKYILNRTDHVKVACSGNDLNRFSILPSRWYGVKAGFRPVATKPVHPDRVNSLNVLILAFDSASHNGFLRKMPLSYKYLAERSIILSSYNVVGDGTAAQLFALLSGKAEDEFPDARKTITKNVFLDDKMFIFYLLKKYGYRTAYFEDMPQIGTFQYRFNGFLRQPADHYLRAFFTEKSKEDTSDTRYCVGAIPQYQMMLNLTDEFFKLDGKKFGFTMITDLGHENFNLITNADEALVSFLEILFARGQLEDTLVLIMGDHGSRFQPIRRTRQGKLEERLPFMAILLPERLKRLRPNASTALKHNSNVLTTPFDIHSTLLDALDLKNESNKYTAPGSDLPRAMSLLEPIPKTRSCSEAGILQHWCACTKWFEIPETSLMHSHVANVLAEYIDNITQEQRSKCERRKLISIESVLQNDVNTQVLTYGFNKDIDAYLGNPKHRPPKAFIEYYQAKIIMSPGQGIFEGTLMYNTQNDSFIITPNDISRINAYGNEPNCISATHPHLYKYCYCKDHLKIATFNESASQSYAELVATH